jgi:hypothetical protein
MREQVAQQTYIRRSSANNGLPYRQAHLSGQDTQVYEDVWPPRMPKSAIRYTTQEAPYVFRNGNKKYIVHTSPPPRTQRATKYQQEDEPRQRRHRIHWSLVFGIGMFVMLSLWILGNLAVHWWQVTQDDWHYGRPRTFQADAVVQHNHDNSQEPSHFVAVNYRSSIQIIEEPAGDTSKAKIYMLPLYGQGEDLAVVMLSFRDLNGDNKPDMIISVASTHIAYLNENNQFRPLKPGEHVSQY